MAQFRRSYSSQAGRSFRQPKRDKSEALLFEKRVASRFADFGWETSVTGGKGDRGGDVIAICGSDRLVIQCKHYDPNSYVPASCLQQAAFARTHYSANLAAVVYRGRPSLQTERDAEMHRITLLPLDELQRGHTLDRTIEGERLRDARRTAVQKADAKKTLEAYAAWCAYRNGLAERKKHMRSFLKEGALVTAVAIGILASIHIAVDTWLLTTVSAYLAYCILKTVGPSYPLWPALPVNSEPTLDQIEDAIRLTKA